MLASSLAAISTGCVKPSSDTLTPDDPDATLLVKIDAEGNVSIGKNPVAPGLDALIAALRDNEKAQRDGRVAVRADEKVPYGKVIEVMSAAREAGIGAVGIASDRL